MAFLDGPWPIALAHRGGSAEGENGLEAFREVEQLGFQYIETDVRTTRDGVLFVFHDEDLQRMTGHEAAVSSMTAAEMAELELPRGESVPTLVEALERFPRLRFNIDLKDDAAVAAVGEALDRARAHDRVCITSFSERRVTEVRRLLGPEVCTGLGVAGVLRVLLRSALPLGGRGMAHGADVAQVPFSWQGIRLVTRTVVERAHDAGLALHVWTLNDRGTIERALDSGVDGVMTDRPQLLKDVLVERGLWAGA